MATIDTSSIDGFDGMTPEQKIEALLRFDIPEKVDLSGYVTKEVADKYASEAASYKKQLAARMTDEEVVKAQSEQAMKDLQEKYNALLRDSAIANHTAKYLTMPGYDEKLARETAEALFDGNMDKVFENQQKANAVHEKKLRADLLKNTPAPEGPVGGAPQKANIELARSIGKAKADSAKTSDEILKQYL